MEGEISDLKEVVRYKRVHRAEMVCFGGKKDKIRTGWELRKRG